MNLSEISFQLLYCVPEAYSKIDYHILSMPYDFSGTKLWSMKIFCNCATGAYFLPLNIQPTIGNQVHHVLAVHTMNHWTMRHLPHEILSIITDNSVVMGCVQKEDIDEVVRQGPGGGIFHKFFGLNDTKIA